jgi:glycosyltransferase involved in cell wall biosynthesis
MIGIYVQPEISVVVPVYNVEEYLERCLDSIRAQTFPSFEVLLINDGSTDGSAAICEAYTGRDARFLLIQQENGGQSAARNRGIEEACGAYLAFIDGDDCVEPTFLEVLYNLATQNQADMAVCSINNVYGEQLIPQYGQREIFTCSAREALRLTLEGHKIPGSMCCRLLRAEAARDLRFPPGLIYEDAWYSARLTERIQAVAVTTEPLYLYHHRRGSSTTECYNPRTLDAVEVYGSILEQVRERYPELLPQALFRYYWAHFVVLDQMLQAVDYRHIKEYPQVRGVLVCHTGDIVRNPCFQPARKLAACALAVNVRLYRLLMRLQQKRLWGDA